jgi:hypothetical protein
MKKFYILGLALFMTLFLGSCYFYYSGDVYGRLLTDTDADKYYVYELGGFPGSGYYLNQDYLVSPGTYRVRYNEIYNGQYWPGNAYGTGGIGGLGSNYYWDCTYRVDGRFNSDQYFTLYLYHDGLGVSGVDSSSEYVGPRSLVDHPGTYVFTENGLTITVTAKIVSCEPGDLSAPRINILSK